ncbi:MAG: ABC-2 family transporter protein [Spirochaetales bacterium]|nr:ABC-2 family transporter protein [Spirochaetales bacterium]
MAAIDTARRRRTGMVRLALHYARFNLSANMAYSTSFVIQIFGMALNNGAFIIFWLVLFERIGGDIAGYGFEEVMFLWSLSAFGFGLSEVVFGNTHQLSRIIYSGELDVYLLQPKPVLINLLMSRTVVAGWGDMLYGVVLFVATQPITSGSVLLFALFCILTALVVTAIRVFYHSLTFYVGNAEGFAQLAGGTVVTFMLYPGSVFRGLPLWILHSLIPAALVAYIPARIFREFNLTLLLIVLAADAAVIAVAVVMFRLGLRRYESGNLIGSRM